MPLFNFCGAGTLIALGRVCKPKNRFLQINLQTIVMCRVGSNQETLEWQ